VWPAQLKRINRKASGNFTFPYHIASVHLNKVCCEPIATVFPDISQNITAGNQSVRYLILWTERKIVKIIA
jgi:hypothetical protein